MWREIKKIAADVQGSGKHEKKQLEAVMKKNADKVKFK